MRRSTLSYSRSKARSSVRPLCPLRLELLELRLTLSHNGPGPGAAPLGSQDASYLDISALHGSPIAGDTNVVSTAGPAQHSGPNVTNAHAGDNQAAGGQLGDGTTSDPAQTNFSGQQANFSPSNSRSLDDASHADGQSISSPSDSSRATGPAWNGYASGGPSNPGSMAPPSHADSNLNGSDLSHAPGQQPIPQRPMGADGMPGGANSGNDIAQGGMFHDGAESQSAFHGASDSPNGANIYQPPQTPGSPLDSTPSWSNTPNGTTSEGSQPVEATSYAPANVPPVSDSQPTGETTYGTATISDSPTTIITLSGPPQQFGAPQHGPNDSGGYTFVAYRFQFVLGGPGSDSFPAVPAPTHTSDPSPDAEQYRDSAPLGQTAQSRAVDSSFGQPGGPRDGQPPQNGQPAQYGSPPADIHRDASGPQNPSPSDVRGVIRHDAPAAASANSSDPAARQAPLPATASAADSSILAPQAALDVTRHSTAAGTTGGILPQPINPSLSQPGDVGSNRAQSGTILVPQASADGANTTVPDVASNGDDGDDAAERETVRDRSSRGATAPALVVAAVDSTAAAELDEAGDPVARTALLANLQLNIEAVDQALDAMVSEIERFGGELATWFDDWTVSNWGTATALVVACGLGGRYWWIQRGRRAIQRDSEEESSSWLFTRLQSPAGHQ